jgi:hypothetical protein
MAQVIPYNIEGKPLRRVINWMIKTWGTPFVNYSVAPEFFSEAAFKEALTHVPGFGGADEPVAVPAEGRFLFPKDRRYPVVGLIPDRYPDTLFVFRSDR